MLRVFEIASFNRCCADFVRTSYLCFIQENHLHGFTNKAMLLIALSVIPRSSTTLVVDKETVFVSTSVVRASGCPVCVRHSVINPVLFKPAPHIFTDHVRTGYPIRLIDARPWKMWVLIVMGINTTVVLTFAFEIKMRI